MLHLDQVSSNILNDEKLLQRCLLDSFTGPIGSSLQEDVWTEPVIVFAPVAGKMPDLPEKVVKKFSRDQVLAYKWGHAIQSGQVPDSLASQQIGPIFHARWLTLCVRCLAKYARVRRPSVRFRKIIIFILNLYLPMWFQIRAQPHIQDGSKHFFTMVTLSKNMDKEAMEVVHSVLSDNSHFAHPENIVITLLADSKEELRRKGVLHILAARRDHDPDMPPRQFIPPQINFEVTLE